MDIYSNLGQTIRTSDSQQQQQQKKNLPNSGLCPFWLIAR